MFAQRGEAKKDVNPTNYEKIIRPELRDVNQDEIIPKNALRAEIITELIPERVSPVNFQDLFTGIFIKAFRLIPVICPAGRAKA